MTSSADSPNRLPWPPMIMVAAVTIGWFLNRILPLGPCNAWLGNVAALWLGVALVVAALALDVSAMTTMHKARTNILPHRPASKLVQSGPFAISRNPIYVGNALLLAGLGLIFANTWLLLMMLAAAIAMHHLAIRREERHLAARFGSEFAAYKDRVPRWLGLIKH